MNKSIHHIFSIAVILAFFFSGTLATAANPSITGNLKRYYPVINDKVKQKAEAGEEVEVLIKLKEEWEHPSIKKMTTAADPEHFISKQDIKRLQKKVLESSFSPKEREKDIKIIHKLENIPWITGRINLKAYEKLKVNPNVAIIAEDIKINVQLAESGPLISSDVVHTGGYGGHGVTVAVIDSGIDTDHPDLQNDLLWEECFLYHGCPGTGGVFGGTRASGPGSAEDGHGHGTHVSGIITSGDAGYKGIAPEAKIVAIKVIDDLGSGYTSDTVAALDWIVSNKDNYGINIVNMSLGSNDAYSDICDSLLTAFAAAADAVKAAGIVLFASSGNAASTAGISSPACLSSVISVGAVYDADVQAKNWGTCIDSQTDTNQIVCYSNVSTELDILAPGAIISSTALGGGIINKSGTSMASPHAAGLAALMIDKNPFLSPDEIENVLVTTGISIYDSRIDLPFPRIEAIAALNLTPDPNHTLTLTTGGSGSGTVTGAGPYNYGDVATVTATADNDSVFEGWSGTDAAECSSGSVNMTDDKTCTATFEMGNSGVVSSFDGYPLTCRDSSIQNSVPHTSFATVQAAIDNALNDYDLIQVTATDFDEEIIYNRNTILTLSGGYTCDYSNNPSISSINSLTIKNGTIIVDKINIQAQP